MDRTDVPNGTSGVMPARRAAWLGVSYGLVAGLAVGVLVVVGYLVWGATTRSTPSYLVALIPMSVLLVVLPITVLGAGVGAATGVLARRRPPRDTPLIAIGIAAAVTTCVGAALAPAGLIVGVLVVGVVAVGAAAVTGARLGRRLAPPVR